MPKFLILAVVVVLLGFASIALFVDQAADTGKSTGATGANQTIHASQGAIYAASFPDAHGQIQTLAQWDGKLLVVNFWATWCGPCKVEMPLLKKLQAQFGGSGLQIVGIAADSQSNVANFGKNESMNYPLLVAETGAIEFSKRLGNRLGLLPHTIMLRPGGEVIYSRLGSISEADMVDIIVKNLPSSR